jgi:DNA-binding HxlR family transcriptional regulator
MLAMRTSLSDVNCSIARTMEILGDCWTALILRDVYAGITRFDALQEDLEISRKTLADRLERLVAQGILRRHVYSVHPPRHDYRPTQKGADLFGVMAAIMHWGDHWTAGPEGPPMLIRHSCGSHTGGQVTCEHCGERLELSACVTEAGPGGGSGHRTRVLGERLATGARATGERLAAGAGSLQPARSV